VQHDGGRVRVCVGLTDYKHHVGTNLALDDALAPAAHAAAALGPDAAMHHMANTLGCTAVLLTADNHLVIQRRSAEVRAPGTAHT
jgi:ADP-heptose:LPS heptosyltransferase